MDVDLRDVFAGFLLTAAAALIFVLGLVAGVATQEASMCEKLRLGGDTTQVATTLCEASWERSR